MPCRRLIVLTCDYGGDSCCGSRTLDVPTIKAAQAIAHDDESWIFHQVNRKQVAWCGKCHKEYTRSLASE